MIVPHGVHSTTGISNEEAVLHTYGSGNGPDCSLIKKGGRVLKNPRSHLLLNRNNSFAFLSVPVDQLGDKCRFFNRSHLWRREGRAEGEGGREKVWAGRGARHR